MSRTVDHRIVEMRFDNKQFEDGAKETMGTLGKLKEALKLPESGKALESLNKATKEVKLDGIAAGIEALEKRFSAMGIVGMRVIENITDGLMNKLNAAVNFVSDSIVSGGIKRAMNIENAHFQLQALLKDEAKVQAVMADAMESVDGTAYAYDEAAKAASQFAASGIQAGEDMLNALKGITGVAAMTNSSFEDVSRIFTTVAGNGRLMGDQLLQLSSRGLNAASTLGDYFREVRGQSDMTEATIREMVTKGKISFKDFSDAMTWAFGDSAKRANETFTGSMSNVKSALARIGAGFISPLVEQNGELVKLFNALRIKINDVKSSLVFDEQRSAISGLAEVTKMSKDELSEMFSTIKANGKVSINDLDTLRVKGANAYSALTKYVNGVTDGSIRASYAITTALTDLTNGTKVSTEDIKRFVQEGQIDLATFTSAMETEFGNEKTLSKQFTDFFLDHIHAIVEVINSADMTKPMEIFYYWVESVKNIAKGLYSVIEPIGKAFSSVFLSFNIDDIITFSQAIENLTSKMKLSEKGSKNLHDAFEGIFSVAKLLIDIFFKLFGAIVPINKPVLEMGDGILGLAGSIGRLLTGFTKMTRSSSLLRKVFDFLTKGFSFASNSLTNLIKKGKAFVNGLSEMEGTKKLVNAITEAFKKLYQKGSLYIDGFLEGAEKIFKSLFKMDNLSVDTVLERVSNAFSAFASVIEDFSFTTVEKGFDTLKNKIKDLKDLFSSNNGIETFIENAKNFGIKLRDAFSWDSVMGRMEKIMDVFGKFFNWVKDTFPKIGEVFEDFNIGSLFGAAGGLGIIYAVITSIKSFSKFVKPLKDSFTGLLSSIKGTLVSYQKELKADALLKIAKAIGILAISITILSFADMKNAWQAAIMLGLVGSALVAAVGYFTDAKNKTKTIDDAAFQLAKAGNNFAKALKWKAIGTTFLKVAESIALIGLTIIGLGLMYKKDPEAMKMGALFVAGISGVLLAIMGLGTLAGQFSGKGMKNFSGLLKSVTALTVGLMIVVLALDKLFKINLPNDYETKLYILAGIMVGMGVLAIILGIAGRIAGGGSSSGMAGIAGYLPGKIGKIAASFTSSSNGGKISSGPILALTAMLYVTVMALDKLFKMKLPDDWEVKVGILAGIMVGIGALMIAMGYAAKNAGGAIKASGTILAMAAFLVVVVGSLFVLTILPADKMLKGAVGLGLVLVAMGYTLQKVGKMSDKDTWKTVLGMAIVVGSITAALSVLAMIPLDKLSKAVVALVVTLLALAQNFKQIGKIINEKSWITVLAMTAAVLAIAYSLYKISEQPWENMLAGAGALSLVLVAMSGAFFIISKSKPNLNSMIAFGEAVAAVLLISYALYKLAEQPYRSILVASTALSEVLLSMTIAMGVASLVGTLGGPALIGIGLLDLFIINIGLILAGLGALSKNEDIVSLMNGGMTMLIMLGDAIGEFVGAIVKGALTQISSGLPQIGSDLSEFMENLEGFIEGSKGIDGDSLKNVGSLAFVIVELTAAEVINGIAKFARFSLPKMATDLSEFMENLEGFIEGSKGLKEENVKACGYLAKMVITLTAADILSGIANFFGFSGSSSNRLADFAAELVAFGPAIRDFAKEVEDVKSESVEGAKSAAEIMAGVADKLQGHGGLWQSIVGNRSLADFAAELVAFGPAIRDFAKDVKDVKKSSVKGAAKAAEIMAEVADKLPEGDSLRKKIFGNSTTSLSEFGVELTSFADSIVPFCDKVSGIKSDSVDATKTVTEIMSTLAQNLPDTSTLWEDLFGGGKTTLTEFGGDLVIFGTKIKEFSDSVVGIKNDQLSGVIENFQGLTVILKDLQGLSPKDLVNFAEQLGKVGIDSVDNFVQAFTDGNIKAENAISTLLNVVSETIQGKNLDFLTKGALAIDQLILGIKLKYKDMTLAGTKIVLNLLNAIEISHFLVKGIGSATQYLTGIKNKYEEAKLTGTVLANNALSGCKSLYNSFYLAGGNAATGFIDGIKSQIAAAAAVGKDLGNAAYNGSRDALDIHSPSRKMGEIGENTGLGFINKLMTFIAKAKEVGKDIGEATFNGISLVMTDDISDPIIKPMVDLSEVNKSFVDIQDRFNKAIQISTNIAASVSSSMKTKKEDTDIKESDQKTDRVKTIVNYNQYNSSPKALSRIDIYRDTKNQLSKFEAEVNGT